MILKEVFHYQQNTAPLFGQIAKSGAVRFSNTVKL